MNGNIGNVMHSWLKDLFPICRSITGNGARETLGYHDPKLIEIANVKDA